MRLLRFRVTCFRSVMDSGWIDVDDTTALIGTNESGKTNLLLPLWKLNPAKEGEIDTTADYPRKLFNDLRSEKPQPIFISGVFAPEDSQLDELAVLSKASKEVFREIQVSKRFDDTLEVAFPLSVPVRTVDVARVKSLIESAREEVQGAAALKSEADLQLGLVDLLTKHQSALTDEPVTGDELTELHSELQKIIPDEPAKTSVLIPLVQQTVEALSTLVAEVSKPRPEDVESVVEFVKEHLPRFVYYSNYGNLDSEIYLPHVIENQKRPDLGPRDQAKARTLKVLFEFVKLKAQEILELGRDFEETRANRPPTSAELDAIAEKKKQRSILLQSASTSLTSRFRNWWKQGEYRFRFEADGRHFRIWVSDDRRPEEIELEGRSTGLQWFLSFYLVFLVESHDAHDGAILLLDEPGLSLHPLAQRDLSAFFKGLSRTNQLIYTTHSPFLVDADHLDRARKVYVGADGTTKATADLRGGDAEASHRGSNYAVHAALGISVAESLMLGCTPVIVEGASDQIYLSAVKTLLISGGKLAPGRELVFPPAGGVRGVKAVASVLGSKEDDLPAVLVDSDKAGRDFAKDLRVGLYRGFDRRVLEVGTFVGLENAEIEDLIPLDVITHEIDRMFRAPENSFSDFAKSGGPVVPQIEKWAADNGVELEPGWKVDLARRVKRVLLSLGLQGVDGKFVGLWTSLFDSLHQSA
jgi:AAA ATPase domain